MSLEFLFGLDGETHTISIAARRPQLSMLVDNEPYVVSESAAAGAAYSKLNVAGRDYEVWRIHAGERVYVRVAGHTYTVDYRDPISAAHQHAGGDDILYADMPGVVVSVACSGGSAVAAGDVLMVIESMKMQINIVSPRDGHVETIHAEANQTFDKGAALIALCAQDP